MPNFEFIDAPPPAATRPGYKNPIIGEFAEALRNHPEQWAIYPTPQKTPESARTLAYRINTGRLGPTTFLPDDTGRFEAVTRDGVVYMRYLKDAANA